MRFFMQGTLSELKRLNEIKNRSSKKKVKLYTVRLLVVMAVVGILAASIYGIFLTTEIALEAAGVSIYTCANSTICVWTKFEFKICSTKVLYILS